MTQNHGLLGLIEKLKSALDNKNFVRAVPIDLSKAFDCISYDLLIANYMLMALLKTALHFTTPSNVSKIRK